MDKTSAIYHDTTNRSSQTYIVITAFLSLFATVGIAY